MSEEISITKRICKLVYFLTLRTRYKVKTTVLPNFLVSSNNQNTYIHNIVYFILWNNGSKTEGFNTQTHPKMFR